ncbi:phosphoglycerate mutase family protein [Protomyces lactucae-debilis]|uniref:Phosphoglycerate mutase family protein n=1 Tax=Protomyces lactucae-debilis TaxID=2754530 RepID=A0A1Y2FSD3_PROLT|nr:phosphoglycerate mutase family protein [Protomyces lactucae-debilis]ORY86920.1 phosphoglycerate mutase family protein [Protomyces lactucae-debilis]
MSSKVFLFRHGETEWSKNGRHTGTTDLPLTQNGVERVKQSAKMLVGLGGLIDGVSDVLVSPRLRAQQTWELIRPKLDDTAAGSYSYTVKNDIQEWDYGAYEGLTSKQINEQLAGSRPWNVFLDGCPQGDNAESATKRLDRLIGEVRDVHKAGHEAGQQRNVLIVAHGHILRAFAARWVGESVHFARRLTYDAGGASRLGYEHGNLDEPTIDVWNVTPDIHCS